VINNIDGNPLQEVLSLLLKILRTQLNSLEELKLSVNSSLTILNSSKKEDLRISSRNTQNSLDSPLNYKLKKLLRKRSVTMKRNLKRRKMKEKSRKRRKERKRRRRRRSRKYLLNLKKSTRISHFG
jgi:hypothetical protein